MAALLPSALASQVCVAMFAPSREQCGISAYSAELIAALNVNPGVSIARVVQPPVDSQSDSHVQAIKGYSSMQRTYRSLGRLLDAKPAEIIHIQHEYALFGGVAPHRSHAAALYSTIKKPVIITVHEIAAEGSEPTRRSLIHWANLRNFVNPAIKGWVVHTTHDRDRLMALGVPLNAIFLVPLGIPAPPILPDATDARERLNLQGKRVVTLFGFLSAKKGHLDAVQAVMQLPDEEVVLVIAGGKHPDDHTAYVADLRLRIEALGAKDRVRITGYLAEPELLQVLAATDVAVVPYLTSSGSASLAQLLAAGIPVVASDIAAFQDVVAQVPGSLFLAPPADPSELARALSDVLDSSVLRAGLIRSGQQYATNNSFSAVASRMVEIYRTVRTQCA